MVFIAIHLHCGTGSSLLHNSMQFCLLICSVSLMSTTRDFLHQRIQLTRLPFPNHIHEKCVRIFRGNIFNGCPVCSKTASVFGIRFTDMSSNVTYRTQCRLPLKLHSIPDFGRGRPTNLFNAAQETESISPYFYDVINPRPALAHFA